jgi:putative transposase
VTVTCRVLHVSTSGYYEWRDREAPHPRPVRRPPDPAAAGHSCRIAADLRGAPLPGRAAPRRSSAGRATQTGGPADADRWPARGAPPPVAPFSAGSGSLGDGVQRRFHADRPDKLWCTDITQHRTSEGWVYSAVVLDVFSRRVVGWSIADHLRTELVVDALHGRLAPSTGRHYHPLRSSNGSRRSTTRPGATPPSST